MGTSSENQPLSTGSCLWEPDEVFPPLWAWALYFPCLLLFFCLEEKQQVKHLKQPIVVFVCRLLAGYLEVCGKGYKGGFRVA